MNKKRRDHELLWAYRMDGADFLLYVVGLLWFAAAVGSDQPTYALCATVWVAGIRLRMIARDTRTDALIREQEEEERRNPSAPVKLQDARQATCPKCSVPFQFPADYNHNNIGCPHCGALVRVA